MEVLERVRFLNDSRGCVVLKLTAARTRNAVGSARAVDRSVFDAGILDDGRAIKFGYEFDETLSGNPSRKCADDRLFGLNIDWVLLYFEYDSHDDGG
jgi:hypothetical protein